MTDYFVFFKPDSNDWWQFAGKTPARSAKAAIRDVIDRGDVAIPDNGRVSHWVATPARSWQPVTVTTETKTQLKFS